MITGNDYFVYFLLTMTENQSSILRLMSSNALEPPFGTSYPCKDFPGQDCIELINPLPNPWTQGGRPWGIQWMLRLSMCLGRMHWHFQLLSEEFAASVSTISVSWSCLFEFRCSSLGSTVKIKCCSALAVKIPACLTEWASMQVFPAAIYIWYEDIAIYLANFNMNTGCMCCSQQTTIAFLLQF